MSISSGSARRKYLTKLGWFPALRGWGWRYLAGRWCYSAGPWRSAGPARQVIFSVSVATAIHIGQTVPAAHDGRTVTDSADDPARRVVYR
jgi:hypothetical protein